MTLHTNCPACGAPLEYTEDQQEIVCSFCSTKIKVLGDGDGEQAQAAARQDTQREEYAVPVTPLEDADLSGEALSGGGVGETKAELFGLEPQPEGPAASSFQEPVSTFGEKVFTPAASHRQAAGGLPKWAVIVIAAVAGLCLLCTCSVGATILIVRSSTGGM